MFMQENKNDKGYLTAKVTILEEMIVEKTRHLNELFENIKRLEGYSSGSKEIVERVSSHIKKQQLDVANLESQKKLTSELSKFIEKVLENTRTYVRQVCGDVERVYFSKQGELLFLQQELDNLAKLKEECKTQLKVLELNEARIKEEEARAEEQRAIQKQEEKKAKEERAKARKEKTSAKEVKKNNDSLNKTKTRIRPDKDPSTRVGQAVLDIAERKRKYREKVSK